MNLPLLSVIVPCYNMELYLERCVKSILEQTYSNLEILLIDDGSTDMTPLLCDGLYENNKEKIRVIHQTNQGLSKTREIGINHSTGNFVTFVDADDWIHPEMYSIMMNGMLKENVDISQCGVCDVFTPHGFQFILKHRKTENIDCTYSKYDKTQGVLKILDDCDWYSYMWNKIYRKHLFDDITFPIGRGLDEDLSIQHQLFHKASSSIYFESEFYFYLHRPGSICSATDVQSVAKKIIDRNSARWERYLFTLNHEEYHAMLEKMQNIFVSVCLAGLRMVIKNPDLFPENYWNDERTKVQSIPLKKKMKEYFSTQKRIEYFLFTHLPFIYKLIIKHIY